MNNLLTFEEFPYFNDEVNLFKAKYKRLKLIDIFRINHRVSEHTFKYARITPDEYVENHILPYMYSVCAKEGLKDIFAEFPKYFIRTEKYVEYDKFLEVYTFTLALGIFAYERDEEGN